jgi:hypothetical protein
VIAHKVDGVTREQIHDAKHPIPVARFQHHDHHMGVRCAGATGELICEVWNLDADKLVAASSDLKVCRDGNDIALLTEKEGMHGSWIIIPTGFFIGDPHKHPVCGG